MTLFAGSRARDAELQFTNTVIESAEIKTLNAEPVELVPAPGEGYMIEFVSAVLVLDAGTNVLVEDADNLTVNYTDGSGATLSNTIECTGFIDQAEDTVTLVGPATSEPIVTAAAAGNAPLVLVNPNDEFTGNAAGDAKLYVRTAYRVHNLYQ